MVSSVRSALLCATLVALANGCAGVLRPRTTVTQPMSFRLGNAFAGPEAVLAYLSRYTHRVAIANSRLLAMDEHGITFRWKDYRDKGRTRHKTMTLSPDEFMRRFLLHVLPSGFHRIRHYGLFANAGRHAHLARARELLQVAPAHVELKFELKFTDADAPEKTAQPTFVCPDCGAAMIIVEILARKPHIRAPPPQGGAP